MKAEPLVFGALNPLLRGKRQRYQRGLLVQKYLRGKGAEIGAFEAPHLVPIGSSTRYIDRVPASEHRKLPEYRHLKLVEPDIIDDGARLSKVADNSLDYLIAAHVLEHIDDPVSAVKNWVRVVRPGGHLLIIVPDKRFMFDRHREVTPVDHFFRDHEEGAQVSAEEHYREIAAKHLNLTSEEDIQAFVDAADPAAHFHTSLWSPSSSFCSR